MKNWIQAKIYFDRDDSTVISVFVESNVEGESNVRSLEQVLLVAFAFRQLSNVSLGNHAKELSGWLSAVGMSLNAVWSNDKDIAQKARGFLNHLLDDITLTDRLGEPSGKRFEVRLQTIELDSGHRLKLDSWPKGFPLFGMLGNTPYHAALAVKGLVKYLCAGKDVIELWGLGLVIKEIADARLSGELNMMNQLEMVDSVMIRAHARVARVIERLDNENWE